MAFRLRSYQISRYLKQHWTATQPFTLTVACPSAPPEECREPQIPPYKEKVDEPLKLKKARLLYQSRKRGMLENDLLLASFAAKYLEMMSPEQVQQYDRLINLPSNDWDIYYWATGVKPTPAEFDTEIMKLLKEHVQNKDRQSRIRQPDLGGI